METLPKPKKRGAQITGFRPIATTIGRGPVFEIRQALGLSQAQLSEKAGCAKLTISRAEYSGGWPKSRAVQSHIRGLVSEAGLDLNRWPLPDSAAWFCETTKSRAKINQRGFHPKLK